MSQFQTSQDDHNAGGDWQTPGDIGLTQREGGNKIHIPRGGVETSKKLKNNILTMWASLYS